MTYDIFISYRRKGGAERAELLKAIFMQHGYQESKIFMDTHSLRGGDFKIKLTDAIKESHNVVVLITRGCFDDIKENDYWVYEIAKALEYKKNIIPVLFDGINSIQGENLPKALIDLPSHNAVGYNHEYTDAFYKKLLSFLITDNYSESIPFSMNSIGSASGSPLKPSKSSIKEYIKANKISLACIIILLLAGLVASTVISNNYNKTEKATDYRTKGDFIDLGLNTNPKSSTEKLIYPITQGVFIDLGLSVNWASCNIGASSPEKAGNYFSWGEIAEKDEYTRETYAYRYSHYGYTETMRIANDISGTEYDAATVLKGGKYRMPTKEEMKELIKECKWEFYKINDIDGMKVTGKNGNSIFIPETGHKNNLSLDNMSFYWTSTAHDYGNPYSLYISAFPSESKVDLVTYIGAEYGLPIRPVMSR